MFHTFFSQENLWRRPIFKIIIPKLKTNNYNSILILFILGDKIIKMKNNIIIFLYLRNFFISQ
jgi:hypothetical protein